MLIQEAVLKKKKEYEKKEEQFFKNNPGKIMNNYSIKLGAIHIAKGCDTIGELQVLADVYKRLSVRSGNGINGFYKLSEAFEEIIEESKKEQ